jgi:hypothetical protein
MSSLTHFDIVIVADTRQMREREVASSRGVIVGISPGEHDEDAPAYAVKLDGLGTTVMLSARDLLPTGKRARREDIYDGSSIRVSPIGRVLEDPPGE